MSRQKGQGDVVEDQLVTAGHPHPVHLIDPLDVCSSSSTRAGQRLTIRRGSRIARPPLGTTNQPAMTAARCNISSNVIR